MEVVAHTSDKSCCIANLFWASSLTSVDHTFDKLETVVTQTTTVFFSHTDHESEALEVLWLSSSIFFVKIWEDFIEELAEEEAM